MAHRYPTDEIPPHQRAALDSIEGSLGLHWSYQSILDDIRAIVYGSSQASTAALYDIMQVLEANGWGKASYEEARDDTRVDDSLDRCEHEMFFSGAGACPKCGGGAE